MLLLEVYSLQNRYLGNYSFTFAPRISNPIEVTTHSREQAGEVDVLSLE